MDFSRIRAIEMIILKMAENVRRVEGYSKSEVYEMMGMEKQALGVN